ncbi:hypothetical protein OHB04_22720 [Streptomyces sp. NBC_01775]|uniref:hypothetical protein n=1 Tax=Streptomyces sp. NBC_01775 TaxID=2975939 RepID=UPI002DD91CE5|nr:hypothetical protein [Streptomyces sp. NBC_01775]WSB78308.1 hypothetical protein OHB04_22720 [Streptomyces sp. NBC_01775]
MNAYEVLLLADGAAFGALLAFFGQSSVTMRAAQHAAEASARKLARLEATRDWRAALPGGQP